MRKVVGLVGLVGLVGSVHADLPTFKVGQVLKAEDLNKIVEAINESEATINQLSEEIEKSKTLKYRIGVFNKAGDCNFKTTEYHSSMDINIVKFNGATFPATVYGRSHLKYGVSSLADFNVVNAKVNGYDAEVDYDYHNFGTVDTNTSDKFFPIVRIKINIGDDVFVRVFDMDNSQYRYESDPAPRKFNPAEETAIEYRDYILQEAANCFEVRG